MTEKRDFWSRRKAAVEAEEAAATNDATRAEDAEKARSLEDKSDEEILTELGLPDPDSLTLGDNVKAFMASGVPDRIRRRALRKLWTTNPVLANLDGLAEYNEDYTDAATVVEDLKTTYQVGKGLLKHIEYQAEQAEKARLAELGKTVEMSETDETGLLSGASVADEKPQENQPSAPASTTNVVVENEGQQGDDDDGETPPRPRRMQFAFNTETP